MIQETQPYDLGIIRKLLLAAFTAEDLRRFCQDDPVFRPIVDRFGPAHGLDDMVDEVLAYCQTQLLLDQLLLHVREVNPRHYARFAQDLGIPLAEGLPEVACPYRGLEPFEAEHAEFYFGREAMVKTLLDRVRDHRFVALVGPSGCGKSSLVRAGLVTALCAGALLGSEQWAVRILYPGADPLRALAAPLVDLLEPEVSEVTRLREGRELADGLRQGTVLLADVAARLRELHPELPRLLLVADQFEELYTECGDEAVRAAFVAALLDAAREKNVAVILTLRADFYGHVLADRRLGEAVDAGLANVLPMDEAELQEAIEQPALRTGRAFEPGLVERIASDVAGEPGNLPLLEFALTELWAWQTAEGLLTHAAYEAIGGVAGAIARRAEEEYADLSARGQGETVRRVLLRLTHYGEATAETRRRATLGDLVTPRTPQAEVEATVRALADARLLVTGKEAMVEVSHEALIRGWERLRRWLDEDRAFGLWRERLAAARQMWQETGQDEGALLRGAPLAEAEGWLAGRGDDLNEAERAFVAASLALREREAAERDAQRQRELAAAQRLAEEQRARAEEQAVNAARMGRRALVIGVVGVVAIVLAVLSLLFWNQAGNSAATATANLALAVTNEAEANSQKAISVTNEARANVESTRAVANEAEANVQKAIAVTNEAKANAESTRAVASAATAQANAEIARVGELAALSMNQLYERLDLALLLGIEAFRQENLLQTRQALFRAWGHNPQVSRFLHGHSGSVRSVAWSADGQLASGSWDGTVILWDLEHGLPGQTLEGHGDAVSSVAWSADGRLASGSWDGTVIVWDLEHGLPGQTLEGHTSVVSSVAWSADGRLASGAGDGTVIVWDLEHGLPAQTLEGHTSVVNSVAWSADGRLASASCGSEGPFCTQGEIIVWNLERRLPGQTLEGHAGEVNSVTWSSDGQLASGADDNTVIVWDLEHGLPGLNLEGHQDAVKSVAWSADGQLASGADDSTVIVWDLEHGVPAQTLQGHTDAVLSIAWSADGRLASGSWDHTVIAWDLERRLPAQTLEGHAGAVNSVAWSADGQLASGAGDGTVIVWDLEHGLPGQTLEGHTSVVRSVAWSADGRLASGSWDGTVIVWDLEHGVSAQTLQGHTDAVDSVAWSADGQLASGADDTTVIVWDLEHGLPGQALEGHAGEVNSVAWSADGRLASGAGDGTVIVWDLERRLPGQTLEGHAGEVNSIAWSADGRLASGSWDHTVIVWDLEHGLPAQTLQGPEDMVLSVAWSADGRLASGSVFPEQDATVIGGTIIVWDLERRLPDLTMERDALFLISVAWSPDARLACGADDNTVQVWIMGPEEWIRQACHRAGRNLTRAEWALYFPGEDYRKTCDEWPAGE